jgi:hypothetical protein
LARPGIGAVIAVHRQICKSFVIPLRAMGFCVVGGPSVTQFHGTGSRQLTALLSFTPAGGMRPLAMRNLTTSPTLSEPANACGFRGAV